MEAAAAVEIAAAFRRKCEVVGVFVNPELEDVVAGGRGRRPDDGPAQRRGGAQLLRRGGAADGVKVIKAIHVAQRRRRPRRGGLPHRLPPLRPPRQRRPLGRHRARASTGASCASSARRVPAIVAGGLRPTTSPRRSPSPIPMRSTSPAASRPSRGARTTPRWRPSSRPPRALASAPHDRESRGTIRPLRGPLRARDADRRPRRARRGLGGGAGRRGLPAPVSPRCDRDFIGRPTPLYLAERLSERADRRVYLKREDLAHTGAHKINNAIGQALLASGWASSGSSPRRAPASTASRQRQPARCFGVRVRRLHGHRGHPSPGAQRRADAPAGGRGRRRRGRRPDPQGGGQRGDPRLGRQRRDDPLRDRLGGRAGAVPGPGPRPPDE